MTQVAVVPSFIFTTLSTEETVKVFAKKLISLVVAKIFPCVENSGLESWSGQYRKFSPVSAGRRPSYRSLVSNSI